MNQRPRAAACFAAGVLAAGGLALGAGAPAAAATPTRIQIIDFNDFHGRIDGNTTKWATTIEQQRTADGFTDANTLLISAGDNIGASLYASASQQDQPTIDVLNALGLDASAVGNHEFDKGFADLRDRVIAGGANATWDYLGANVLDSGTLEPVLPPYVIEDVEGVSVGIIGAVTQETPTLVSPGGITGLTFTDPVVAVNDYAALLTDGNDANGEADVIVAVYHEGAPYASPPATFAEEVTDSTVFAHIVNDTDAAVDAIINGHTHQPYVFTAPDTTRPVIQTGSYGDHIGVLQLSYDADTDTVTTEAAKLVDRVASADTSLPRVAEVDTITQAALDAAEVTGNVEVGRITADITTAYSGGEYVDGEYTGGSRDDRSSESALGNTVADALLDTLADPDRGGAQIGVVNPGGLRNELFYDAPPQAVVPLSPQRILDTRTGASTVDGQFAGTGIVAAGGTLELTVAGRGGVPADATGVVLNLTATDASGIGYVTVWPCGTERPLASSANFAPGAAAPNAVLTGIGADGKVCMYAGEASVHLIADVNGLVPAGGGFEPLTPARLLETREGAPTVDGVSQGEGQVGAGATYTLQVAGRGGVPDGAMQVALNVTATDAMATGYVTVWDCSEPRPIASNVNFVAGKATPNTVVAELGADGKVCLFAGENAVDLIVDVFGTFDDAAPLEAVTPARLLDTRNGAPTVDGIGAGNGPITAGTKVEVQVTGRAGVPATAVGAVLNLTATDAGGTGYVTAWPCDEAQPNASTVNFVAGEPSPNAAVLKLSADGKICLTPGETTAQLIVDVSAYVPGGPAFEDGVVTVAEANAVLPFVNNLWTTTLTGAQFKTLLEQQWQRDAEGNVPTRAYLQLGLSDNVTYTFDASLPEGSRITSITINGEPYDPAANYRIGTFSFLAQGGDNFHVFTDGTDTADSGLVDYEAWIDFIGANSPLSPDFARQAVSVSPTPTTVEPGGQLQFTVSQLDLTSLGSPQNTTLTLTLGTEALGSVAVTDGTAAVDVTVPGTVAPGDYLLTMVAESSQTAVTLPITVGPI
jgi:2',3'-cyclic-nucleotide 2'-phosphodiesterase (5'-nucleotidase family)